MDFFADINILNNILYYLDLNDIIILLGTNKMMRMVIIKHYEIFQVNLDIMPIFTPCHDILLYRQHYHSYITGTNFPDKPLWLFCNKDDGKFIVENNRYKKVDNVRFDRPTFLTLSYNNQQFIDSLEHWQQLNQQQKYIVWCAITGTHPEILLDTSLRSSHLSALISEAYWHYPQSFARYYLDIYFIDNIGLITVKERARNEIKTELKIHNGERYYTTNKFTEKLNNIPQEAFEAMLNSNEQLKIHFAMAGIKTPHDMLKMYDGIDQEGLKESYSNNEMVDNIKNQFGCQHVSSDDIINQLSQTFTVILNESEILQKIIDEIENFDITCSYNLTTTNTNYFAHMKVNHPIMDFSIRSFFKN